MLNFASEPKKPEQDLKGMKSADATNTSEKASDQGKAWGSCCSLQYPTHLICLEVLIGSILTLETALPPQPNLLSTAHFIKPNCNGAWRTPANSEKRAPTEFNFCLCFGWVQVVWTWKSCIVVLGNLLCRVCVLHTLWRYCERDGYPTQRSTGNSNPSRALLLC